MTKPLFGESSIVVIHVRIEKLHGRGNAPPPGPTSLISYWPDAQGPSQGARGAGTDAIVGTRMCSWGSASRGALTASGSKSNCSGLKPENC